MVVLVRQYRQKFGTLTRDKIKKINSYKFENPSFAVMMQPSYVKYKFSLNVPFNFASKYLKTKGSFTLENTKGDAWQVSCVGKTERTRKIQVGWKKFALDNKLQVGDICVFEMVNHANCLFKVEIIRCSSCVRVQDWSNIDDDQ
ncbi:hypothetical protein RND81_09G062900 [Saponaria officinalis]|uniref:TF-B3 domain-containing protein n=1 Tax=Saponaria officinalis TaxID=3572 RepID=A0AAW1IJE3_SAPOF